MDEIPKSKTQLELEKYERENNLNQPKSSRFENHFKDSNNDNNTSSKRKSLFNNNDVRTKKNEQAYSFAVSLFNQNPNANKKLNDAVNGYCIKAILSLVFAFIFWPVGLYYAIVALKQIKKNPEMKGKGFAITAIILSIFYISMFIVPFIVMIIIDLLSNQ